MRRPACLCNRVLPLGEEGVRDQRIEDRSAGCAEVAVGQILQGIDAGVQGLLLCLLWMACFLKELILEL